MEWLALWKTSNKPSAPATVNPYFFAPPEAQILPPLRRG